MINVTIMVVPGKMARVDVLEGATVVALADKAKTASPGIDWLGLAKDREVRVNKKKFSNVAEVDATKGYAGSILSTPLNDGDVVLIITKIKGNDGTTGVLTCTINDEEYALETPDTIANVLKDVAKINLDDVVSVEVNGDEANLQDLVGDEDYIVVALKSDEVEANDDDDDEPVIIVNGVTFCSNAEGKLEAIQAIIEL